MARPERNNVDYFPHDCTHGRKMYIIESKYGNDGYAVWFKLLEQIGLAEYHYLDLREETQLLYLSSLMKIDLKTFEDILNDLAKINAIHSQLYKQHKIIWSSKFIDSIEDAYSRRNNKCLQLQSLCNHLSIKLKQKRSKCKPTVDINPQSIGEDIKEEDIKLNNPFSEIFLPIWNKWKSYKKDEHKFKFKSIDTEQIAIDNLMIEAKGNEEMATKIIFQSIANGWKGFFKLKENGTDRKQELANALYKKFNPKG